MVNFTRTAAGRYVSDSYAGPGGQERFLITRDAAFVGLGWAVTHQTLAIISGREYWDTLDVLLTRTATLREARRTVTDHFHPAS